MFVRTVWGTIKNTSNARLWLGTWVSYRIIFLGGERLITAYNAPYPYDSVYTFENCRVYPRFAPLFETLLLLY